MSANKHRTFSGASSSSSSSSTDTDETAARQRPKRTKVIPERFREEKKEEEEEEEDRPMPDVSVSHQAQDVERPVTAESPRWRAAVPLPRARPPSSSTDTRSVAPSPPVANMPGIPSALASRPSPVPALPAAPRAPVTAPSAATPAPRAAALPAPLPSSSVATPARARSPPRATRKALAASSHEAAVAALNAIEPLELDRAASRVRNVSTAPPSPRPPKRTSSAETTAAARVQEYPTEPLAARNRQQVDELIPSHQSSGRGNSDSTGHFLVCLACQTLLARKRSSIHTHLASKGHKGKMLTYSEEKIARVPGPRLRQDLEMAVQYPYSFPVRLPNPHVPMHQVVFRLQFMFVVMRQLLPLSCITAFRPLLASYRLSLAGATHASEFIPWLLCRAKQINFASLTNQYFTLAFDSTPLARARECFSVVARFCDDKFEIRHVLLAVRRYTSSFNSDHIAAELRGVLSQIGCESHRLVGLSRDSAAANTLAVRALQREHPQVQDSPCLSHLLARSGTYLNTPTLHEFDSALHELNGRSFKLKNAFLDRCGEAIKSYSKTRWWSLFECHRQLHRLWDQFVALILNVDISDSVNGRFLVDLFRSPRLVTLRLELEASVIFGEIVCACTYTLEANSNLLHRTAGLVATMLNEVDLIEPRLPFSGALFTLFDSEAQRQAGQNVIQSAMRPAIDYVRALFQPTGLLYGPLQFFEAARALSHEYARANTVAELTTKLTTLLETPMFSARVHPSLLRMSELSGLTLEAVLAEVPVFKAISDSITEDITFAEFWAAQRNLPFLRAAARRASAVLPSSAAPERVFSRLDRLLAVNGDQMLDDSLQLSLFFSTNSFLFAPYFDVEFDDPSE